MYMNSILNHKYVIIIIAVIFQYKKHKTFICFIQIIFCSFPMLFDRSSWNCSKSQIAVSLKEKVHHFLSFDYIEYKEWNVFLYWRRMYSAAISS